MSDLKQEQTFTCGNCKFINPNKIASKAKWEYKACEFHRDFVKPEADACPQFKAKKK